MDRFAKLVSGAALVLAAFSANAGYAQLAPPLGWTAGTGAVTGGGQFAMGQAANSATLGSATVRTNASLNVAGRAVSVPASMRFAANAPRIAAAAIFMSPHLRAALGIASWLGVAGVVWDEVNSRWTTAGGGQGNEQSNGLEYRAYWDSIQSSWQYSAEDACGELLAKLIPMRIFNTTDYNWSFDRASGGSCYFKGAAKTNPNYVTESTAPYASRNGSCPAGWYITPAGCTQTPQRRALTQEEMVELLNPANSPGWPMPNSVPREIPGTPLPIEIPVINPSTGVDPFPQPLFIPTGNPVSNPNYDPNAAPSPSNQPFLQPGVRVNPAPVPGSPWQVDIQPVNRPQSTNVPNPNPQTDTVENPGDKPAPEDKPDLCEKYPDILACQKLDEPEDKPLQEIEKDISIHKDVGWGAENASCPPPKILNVQGRQIAIPFDLFCTYMQGMRPIIIAMAWLSAAFILLGARET